ncbi:MAG: hypothetical protein GY773_03000, partial [Actinomycetia bacterium]|nr:hypothetical protein [Actinomycetes bacterium]
FTPTFSAPEVLLGSSVAPTADVYGLAAALWSLISGRPPFRAEDGEENTLMAVVGRVVHQPIDNLRSMAPDAICTVIETGMAKDPATRYPTAGDFAQALSNAVNSIAPGVVASTDATTAMPQASAPAPLHPPSEDRVSVVRFDEAVPPRFIPAQPTTGPAGRFPVIGVIAIAAVAAVILLVGFRALTSDNGNSPPTTSDGFSVDLTVAGTQGSTVTVAGGQSPDDGDNADGEPSDPDTSLIPTTTPEATSTTSEATTTSAATTSTTEATTTTTEATTTTTEATTTTSTTETTTTTTSIPPTPLDPPTSVSASYDADTGAVDIDWLPPASTSGLTGYTVHRDGAVIGSTLPGDTTFVDLSPVKGETHTYRVRAKGDPEGNEPADSVLSAGAQVTIPTL